MARIGTYPNDTFAQDNDKLIGTDQTGNVTKNFTLQFLTDFILDGNAQIGVVPPGHYGVVNEDGTAITQGGISETFTSETNPSLTGVVFSLMRETDGRLLLLVSSLTQPYRVESFVGKTWTSLGFTGANQSITQFIGFTVLNSGEIQYQFLIAEPGNLATFTGAQILSNFVISELDKRAINLNGDVVVTGTLTDANGNPIAGSSEPFIRLTTLPQTVKANQIAVLSAIEQYYNVSGVDQLNQDLTSDFTDTTIWLRVGDSASAGGGFRFVFTQVATASTWTIDHNRGGGEVADRFVDVTIYENEIGTSNYLQVIPESVNPVSSNQTIITFPTNQPVAGIALITG